MVLVLIGCSTNEAIYQGLSIEELTVKFNTDIKNQDYKALASNYRYTNEMKSLMTESKLNETFSKLGAGKVVEFKETVQSEKDGYIIMTTPTIFENASYDINLVFDANNKIAGYNFGAFTDSTTSKEVETEDLMALAIDHHALFADDKFADLMAFDYTDEVLKAVNETFFKLTKSQMNLGKLVKVSEAFSFESQGFLIVSLPVIYENNQFNYNLVFDKNQVIAGLNFGEYQEQIEKESPEGFDEISLVAEVNDLSLDGLLTKPQGDGPFPLVVLVHGSGPADKDETVFLNKPFRDIAWGLAKHGIATYRYDKSTYSNPTKFASDTSMTLYNETVNDAVEIAKMLEARADVSEVYILGHSLGGHAMPLIAEDYQAAGYILMAGNARPLVDLIEEQVPYLLEFDGVVTDQEQVSLDNIKSEIDKIRNLDKYSDTDVIMGGYKAYWAFLNDYSPLEKAKNIEQPVLVLQGDRDYQVTLEDYNLWQTIGKDNWTYKLYPGLNHLMMYGEGKSSGDEYKTKSQVSEVMIKDIANWIKK